MTIRGHLDERLLARLADSSLARTSLSPEHAAHLAGCDRCRRLLRSHDAVLQLLRAEWQLVPASALTGAGLPGLGQQSLGLGPALRAPAHIDLGLSLGLTARGLALLGGVGLLVLGLISAWLIAGGPASNPEAVLYTANGHVFVLDTGTATTLDLGTGSTPAWSRDRRFIAFFDNDRIVGMNRDGSRRQDLGSRSFDGKFYEWLAPSRDGRWLLVTTGMLRDDLSFLIDTRTGERSTLSQASWKEVGPGMWSPTSDRAVFVGTSGKNLVVVDASANQPVESDVGSVASYKSHVSWGPDDRIAYTSVGTLETVAADGSGTRVVRRVAADAFLQHVAWSPDGQSIAFGLLDAAGYEIDLVEVATGEVQTLQPPSPEYVDVLGWSADGQTVRVQTQRGPAQAPTTEVRWLGLDGAPRRSIDLGAGVEEVAR